MRSAILIACMVCMLCGEAFSQAASGWGYHSGFRISSAFSHSGKILALADDTGLALMEVRTRRIIRSFSLPKSYCGFRQMVFAPRDTALFLVGCNSYVPNTSGIGTLVAGRGEETRGIFSIQNFNIHTGTLTTLDSDFQDCHISLSPDGAHIAVLERSGILSLYKIGSFQPIRTMQMPAPQNGLSEYFSWFSHDCSKLAAYWFGHVIIYDAQTLGGALSIEDSQEYATPQLLGCTVFLTHAEHPILIDIQSGTPATIQPPELMTEYKYMWMAPETKTLRAVGAGIVCDGKYLIARYEVRTTGIPFEGGPRAGTDTLLITPLGHPNERWGIAIDPASEVSDSVPASLTPALVISDGKTIRLVNLRSRSQRVLFDSGE